jgi:hypothetical protein
MNKIIFTIFLLGLFSSCSDVVRIPAPQQSNFSSSSTHTQLSVSTSSRDTNSNQENINKLENISKLEKLAKKYILEYAKFLQERKSLKDFLDATEIPNITTDINDLNFKQLVDYDLALLSYQTQLLKKDFNNLNLLKILNEIILIEKLIDDKKYNKSGNLTDGSANSELQEINRIFSERISLLKKKINEVEKKIKEFTP